MSDNVNKPNHYISGSVECIDGIRAALGGGFVSYCRGNVLKYVWRCGKKGDAIEDLRKAAKYLEWAIEALERDTSESQSVSHVEGVWVEEAGKVEPTEWIPKVGDKVRVVGNHPRLCGQICVVSEVYEEPPLVSVVSDRDGDMGFMRPNALELIEAAQ